MELIVMFPGWAVMIAGLILMDETRSKTGQQIADYLTFGGLALIGLGFIGGLLTLL